MLIFALLSHAAELAFGAALTVGSGDSIAFPAMLVALDLRVQLYLQTIHYPCPLFPASILVFFISLFFLFCFFQPYICHYFTQHVADSSSLKCPLFIHPLLTVQSKLLLGGYFFYSGDLTSMLLGSLLAICTDSTAHSVVSIVTMLATNSLACCLRSYGSKVTLT